MSRLYDRAMMTTATTGTGTMTLGSAVSPYQTFGNAGVPTGARVPYTIEDTGAAWEIGFGTYTSSGTTLTRNLLSSSTGSLLNLSGSAQVFIDAGRNELEGMLSHPGYIAGQGYGAMPTGTGTTGAALGADSIKLQLFQIHEKCTLDAIGARIITLAVAGNIKFAIYANNYATMRPTGNALAVTGNQSTTLAGANWTALSSNVQFDPGWYWLAIWADNGTVAMVAPAAGPAGMGYTVGSATIGNLVSSGAGLSLFLTVSSTYGTFPDLTAASFTEAGGVTSTFTGFYRVNSVP